MQLRAGDYDGNFPTATSLKEELFVFACRQVCLKPCPEFWKGTMTLLDFIFEFYFSWFSAIFKAAIFLESTTFFIP